MQEILELLEAMQSLFSVDHHENFNFKTLSGGKMNLELP